MKYACAHCKKDITGGVDAELARRGKTCFGCGGADGEHFLDCKPIDWKARAEAAEADAKQWELHKPHCIYDDLVQLRAEVNKLRTQRNDAEGALKSARYELAQKDKSIEYLRASYTRIGARWDEAEAKLREKEAALSSLRSELAVAVGALKAVVEAAKLVHGECNFYQRCALCDALSLVEAGEK